MKPPPAKAAIDAIEVSLHVRPLAQPRRHILFIIDSFWGAAGGAEGALIRIIRRLPAERFRCSVATFAAKSDIHRTWPVPCPIYVFPFKWWKAPAAAWALHRLIRRERVDIVHTFFEISDLFGGIVAKLSGCPILISSRRDMGFRRKRIHRLAYRLIGRYYDQVQTVSDEVRNFCVRQDRIAREKIVTVHNGVEVNAPAQRMFPSDLDIADASHVIVSVGNIRAEKGFDALLRTAAIVCKRHPRAMFLVLGRVNHELYYRELLTLRAALKLESNVHFAGRRMDVPAILPACDIFCLLSRTEGFSNAVLEAMAAGLPVLATCVGGNAEAVADGQSGFLVPPEDEMKAADRLLKLMDDDALRRRMGALGRSIVEQRFTADAMVKRMVRHYDDLLHSSSQRSQQA